MSTWYWKNAQQAEPQGPISANELKHLALSNKLNPTDYVWKEGMKGWVQADNLKGLFDPSASRSERTAFDKASVQSAPRRQSAPSQSVHHSNGMYQKSGQDSAGSTSSGTGSFSRASVGAGSLGSTMSFGQPGTVNSAFSGMDYEALPTFFSFRGRVRRTTYFLQSVGISFGLFIVLFVLIIMSGGYLMEESVGASLILLMVSIAGTVVLSFPFVKRLHDLNLSAWYYWISFIPLINLIFGLYVLFGRGSEGPNKYGPDPRS